MADTAPVMVADMAAAIMVEDMAAAMEATNNRALPLPRVAGLLLDTTRLKAVGRKVPMGTVTTNFRGIGVVSLSAATDRH